MCHLSIFKKIILDLCLVKIWRRRHERVLSSLSSESTDSSSLSDQVGVRKPRNIPPEVTGSQLEPDGAPVNAIETINDLFYQVEDLMAIAKDQSEQLSRLMELSLKVLLTDRAELEG